ncbi:hypothetical protein SBV1_1770006 [Verrucomicrobia bacterium]|nr:hypothetical protein SBV1_1770006 [Verrucomicrobiota bacterium]
MGILLGAFGCLKIMHDVSRRSVRGEVAGAFSSRRHYARLKLKESTQPAKSVRGVLLNLPWGFKGSDIPGVPSTL